MQTHSLPARKRGQALFDAMIQCIPNKTAATDDPLQPKYTLLVHHYCVRSPIDSPWKVFRRSLIRLTEWYGYIEGDVAFLLANQFFGHGTQLTGLEAPAQNLQSALLALLLIFVG